MKPDAPLPPVEEIAPTWTATILRLCLRLAIILLIVWGVHSVLLWLESETHTIGKPQTMGFLILAAMLAAYALLIATPFVPGIEIGLALMFLQGDKIVPFVYLATVIGLFLSYAVGSRLGYATLHRLFADLRVRSACRLLERIAPLTPDERLALIADTLPRWIGPKATQYRYVLLGVLINLPGNGLIGGGGGLALLAGLSRLYSATATALTFLIAVAPVPLVVWFFDRPVLPLPS
ncbi:hypothetical protein [Flavimaricola marinus]|uniref:hypothetical protein n=1 Tax=Flavimaricola marinus TaxID=1819565 RepID=UPI00105619F4|nr:hypothetical protein [Flavimaricola marinus]